MPKPYSQDLRDRVIDAVERGETSRRAAARRYEISESVAIKWRQRTAIARSQLLESLPTTATQRFIPSCALRKQQSFDPIDVQDPFVSQHSTLTAQASAVLFLGCGRLDHRAHTRLAALIRQKRAKQRLAVHPVGLSSPAPTRRRDRSGIDNVAFDPFALQNPVNPEAVQSRFLNDNDWERSFSPHQRLLPEFRKTRQQRADVSGR